METKENLSAFKNMRIIIFYGFIGIINCLDIFISKNRYELACTSNELKPKCEGFQRDYPFYDVYSAIELINLNLNLMNDTISIVLLDEVTDFFSEEHGYEKNISKSLFENVKYNNNSILVYPEKQTAVINFNKDITFHCSSKISFFNLELVILEISASLFYLEPAFSPSLIFEACIFKITKLTKPFYSIISVTSGIFFVVIKNSFFVSKESNEKFCLISSFDNESHNPEIGSRIFYLINNSFSGDYSGSVNGDLPYFVNIRTATLVIKSYIIEIPTPLVFCKHDCLVTIENLHISLKKFDSLNFFSIMIFENKSSVEIINLTISDITYRASDNIPVISLIYFGLENILSLNNFTFLDFNIEAVTSVLAFSLFKFSDINIAKITNFKIINFRLEKSFNDFSIFTLQRYNFLQLENFYLSKILIVTINKFCNQSSFDSEELSFYCNYMSGSGVIYTNESNTISINNFNIKEASIFSETPLIRTNKHNSLKISEFYAELISSFSNIFAFIFCNEDNQVSFFYGRFKNMNTSSGHYVFLKSNTLSMKNIFFGLNINITKELTLIGIGNNNTLWLINSSFIGLVEDNQESDLFLLTLNEKNNLGIFGILARSYLRTITLTKSTSSNNITIAQSQFDNLSFIIYPRGMNTFHIINNIFEKIYLFMYDEDSFSENYILLNGNNFKFGYKLISSTKKTIFIIANNFFGSYKGLTNLVSTAIISHSSCIILNNLFENITNYNGIFYLYAVQSVSVLNCIFLEFDCSLGVLFSLRGSEEIEFIDCLLTSLSTSKDNDISAFSLTFYKVNKNILIKNNKFINISCSGFYIFDRISNLYFYDNYFEAIKGTIFDIYLSFDIYFMRNKFFKLNNAVTFNWVNLNMNIKNNIFFEIFLIAVFADEGNEIFLEENIFNNIGELNKAISTNFKTFSFSIYNIVSVYKCLFSDGKSDSGSAIYLIEKNEIFIEHCLFINNTVSYFGSVIISYNSNSLFIKHSCFAFSQALDGNAGVIHLDQGHENISITLTYFFDSFCSNKGGIIYFGSSNKNITLEKNVFLHGSAFEGAAFYFNTKNSDITIHHCVFAYIYSIEAGTIIFLKTFNINLKLYENIWFSSNSLKILGNVYLDKSNIMNMTNITLLFCSEKDLNYHFQINSLNKGFFSQLVIIDRNKKGILDLEGDFNIISFQKIEFYYYKVTYQQINSYTMISISSKVNCLDMVNSKLSGILFEEALILIDGQNNSISITDSFFSNLTANYFIMTNYRLHQNLSHKISLIRVSIINSNFKLAFISCFLSKLIFFKFYNLINLFTTPGIVLANFSEINFNHSRIKIRLSRNNYVSLNLLSSFLIEVLNSVLVIYKSEFIGGMSRSDFNKSLIILTNSRTLISSSYFLLFGTGNQASLFFEKGSNTSTLNFENNFFLRITGEYGVGLVDYSNLGVFSNFFILNGGRSMSIRSDVFTVLPRTADDILIMGNEFETCLQTRTSASLIKHDFKLPEVLSSSILENNLVTSSDNMKNTIFLSSYIYHIYLMPKFSSDPGISIYNQSYNITDISSKRLNLNCYISIIALDDYLNIQPLITNTIGTEQFTVIDEFNDVLYYFEVYEYSFCLSNITNLNNFELERHVESHIYVKELPLNLSYVKVDENYSLILGVTFRNCLEGEAYDSTNNLCLLCENGYRSINFFEKGSGFISICERCKENDIFNCFGSDIYSPKPGYARLSLESNNFLPCPNKKSCLGDPFYSYNSQYQSAYFWTRKVGVGLCENGYRGVLCSSCENDYGTTGAYKCFKCDGLTYILGLLIKIPFRIIILYTSITTALSINHSFEENQCIETYVAKMNFFLKILINHFQVLMMIKALPFYLPETLDQVFSTLIGASAPDLGSSLSFECLLKNFNVSIPAQYFKIISIFAFNIITFFLFLVFEYFRVTGIRKKSIRVSRLVYYHDFNTFIKNYGTNLILLILIITFIDQLKPVLELLACVDVGDPNKQIQSKRLITQLEIECDDRTHLFWTLVIGLPIFLLIGIAFPFTLIRTLYLKCKNKTLYSIKTVSKFGCLYYGYKPEKYYYEFIVVFRKFCFMTLQVFFFTYPGNSELFSIVNVVLLLLLVTSFFYLLQVYIDPYNKEFFSIVHKCDVISFLVLKISIFLGVFWVTRGTDISNGESMLILVIGLISNAAFLGFWGWKFFDFFSFEIKKLKVYTNIKMRLSKGKFQYQQDSTSSESVARQSSIYAISGLNTISPIKVSVKERTMINDMQSYLSQKSVKISPEEKGEKTYIKRPENFFYQHSEQTKQCLERIKDLEAIIAMQKIEIKQLEKALNEKKPAESPGSKPLNLKFRAKVMSIDQSRTNRSSSNKSKHKISQNYFVNEDTGLKRNDLVVVSREDFTLSEDTYTKMLIQTEKPIKRAYVELPPEDDNEDRDANLNIRLDPPDSAVSNKLVLIFNKKKIKIYKSSTLPLVIKCLDDSEIKHKVALYN